MKVKSQPGDFVVEELTDAVCDGGEFALYRLQKTNWTTPDALHVIRRRWDVHHERMSYGGLKDRHAITTQYLSIWRGPERNLEQDGVAVTFLGWRREPFTSQDIRANRFEILLRDATIDTATIDEVARCGVPNYFDDQRFGSVEPGGPFIALEMIHGRFEEALKLALAAPYEFDRAEVKKEKAILKHYWGDFPALKQRLERGHARSLIDFLCQRPGDFKGAVARLRPELSGLYLSAYQSHVWNRMLARSILARTTDAATVQLKLGNYPAPRQLVRDFDLPLPSARWKGDPALRELIDAVLAEDGLTLERMKIPGLQKPYFSRGERAAILWPAKLQVTPRGRDASLTFELPRGSYATMVIKRLVLDGPVATIGTGEMASE